MNTRILSVFSLLKRVGFAILFLGVSFVSHLNAAPLTVNAPSNTYFIANEGQWEGDFSFKCKVGSAVYYVTPKGMTVDFREFKRYPRPRDPGNPMDIMERHEDRDSVTVRGHVVQIHYNGANKNLTSMGEGKLAHYSNYFLGSDSAKWRSRVGHFQNIIVPEVWPGIDVEYRADQLGVESVYHVKPGADPAQIQMEYLGLDAPLRIDVQENLVLTTSLGDVKEKAPFAFQQVSRMQQRVESRYRVVDNTYVEFELDGYDSTKELVVDPLLYGTYLGGGSTDYLDNIGTDGEGGMYVAGTTYALSGFPTTPGAYDETGIFPGYREFVSHFSAEGAFTASTLFGEIQTSENRNTEGGATDLVYDPTRGAIWICGVAYPDWPLSLDAMDTTIELGESFVLGLSADLTTLEYCSYLGGSQYEYSYGIEIDSLGRIYVAGETNSPDFPLSDDALFTEVRGGGDGFLWAWEPSSYTTLFSTFFGGSGEGAPELIWGSHLCPDGNVWVYGTTNSVDLPVSVNAFQSQYDDSGEFPALDAFVAQFAFSPATVEYCSYLGGGSSDYILTLQEMDSSIYLAGWTSSTNFPISQGAFDTVGPPMGFESDGFIARLNWLTSEYAATFVGGEENDYINVSGNWVGRDYCTVTGRTSSADLPITTDAFQPLLNQNGSGSGSVPDCFVLRLSRDLSSSDYGTFFGGTFNEYGIVGWVENEDSVWLAVETESFDVPVTPDAFQPNDNPLNSGFVAHFAIDTTADTTNAAEHAPFPSDFAFSAYPNPFNPTTTLSFTLPVVTHVHLLIFNILGQEMERIDLGSVLPGEHRLAVGRQDWSTGIYIAAVCTPTYTETLKLLILR